ncbi:MAG: hypothetical protein KKG33_14145 [candidate division Zixibacteria bacterium]|nr:hypothetical protein [candidate division Zixibacteria bacterium]MBU1470664.1 hypothetical protein [candidate division Zixibacteria bacterium]MBU2626694.1 hypothetical protein [candidate division Zixibacteria bacterium]
MKIKKRDALILWRSACALIFVFSTAELYAQADHPNCLILGHAFVTLGDGSSNLLRGQEILLLERSTQYDVDETTMEAILLKYKLFLDSMLIEANSVVDYSADLALVSRQHDIIGHVIDFRNCLRYICANKEVVDEKVHRSIIEGGA